MTVQGTQPAHDAAARAVQSSAGRLSFSEHSAEDGSGSVAG